MSQRIRTVLLTLPLALLVTSPAYGASTGDLPWEGILKKLSDSVSGPVASALIIMGIVAGGAYWFFSENQRGLVQIVKALIVGGIVSGITAFLGLFNITTALI